MEKYLEDLFNHIKSDYRVVKRQFNPLFEYIDSYKENDYPMYVSMRILFIVVLVFALIFIAKNLFGIVYLLFIFYVLRMLIDYYKDIKDSEDDK